MHIGLKSNDVGGIVHGGNIEVLIDGHQRTDIRSIDLHFDAESYSTATIEYFLSGIDIDATVDSDSE